MLTITDATLCSIQPKPTDENLIRELYQKLLELGVDRVEITPEIYSILKDTCDLSRSLIQHASAETSVKTALKLSAAYAPDMPPPQLSANPFFMPGSELRVLGSEDLLREDYHSIFEKILRLPYPVTFCAKNSGFSATALTVEWVYAGGKNIVCSFMGCGRYAPLEEILLALKVNGYPMESINTPLLKTIGSIWEKLTGLSIPPYKPIVGERVFEVESGIHIDGILKNSMNYEPFSPETVGSCRKFFIGKFSGKKALTRKLNELNLLDQIKEPERLLCLIKEKCLLENTVLSDSDLFSLFSEINDSNNSAGVS